MRDADGRFDRCVLYSRTIAALDADRSGMLGLTRDGAGSVGAMVFFEPGAFTRGRRPVSFRIDRHDPMSLTGDVISDFHVVISGPLPAETLAALGQATAVEVAVEDKTIRIAASGVGAMHDRRRNA